MSTTILALTIAAECLLALMHTYRARSAPLPHRAATRTGAGTRAVHFR